MGEAQMSRVQRELLELKQRGQVKTRADKLQECKLMVSVFRLSGVTLEHSCVLRSMHCRRLIPVSALPSRVSSHYSGSGASLSGFNEG